MTRKYSNACLGLVAGVSSRRAGRIPGRNQAGVHLSCGTVRLLCKVTFGLKPDSFILAVGYRTKTQLPDYQACLDDYRSFHVTLQHFQNSNMGFGPSTPTGVTKISDAV
jgi:hypothetical protein